MNRNILKYVIALVLCMTLMVSAASALDDLFFYQAKQNLIKQYAQHTSGGGSGGVKPLPGLAPGGSLVYVGQLPFIMRAGDTLDLKIYGEVLEGQRLAFQIVNGQFSAPQGEFVFNVTGVQIPANASQVNVTVQAQPVTELRIESKEAGIIKSMESSSPDKNGVITLAATGLPEDKTQTHDYMVTTGTPSIPMITMNYKLEGLLTEDAMNPVIPFHIEQAQRGSFTIVVSLDNREKLREAIFVL